MTDKKIESSSEKTPKYDNSLNEKFGYEDESSWYLSKSVDLARKIALWPVAVGLNSKLVKLPVAFFGATSSYETWQERSYYSFKSTYETITNFPSSPLNTTYELFENVVSNPGAAGGGFLGAWFFCNALSWGTNKIREHGVVGLYEGVRYSKPARDIEEIIKDPKQVLKYPEDLFQFKGKTGKFFLPLATYVGSNRSGDTLDKILSGWNVPEVVSRPLEYFGLMDDSCNKNTCGDVSYVVDKAKDISSIAQGDIPTQYLRIIEENQRAIENLPWYEQALQWASDLPGELFFRYALSESGIEVPSDVQDKAEYLGERANQLFEAFNSSTDYEKILATTTAALIIPYSLSKAGRLCEILRRQYDMDEENFQRVKEWEKIDTFYQSSKKNLSYFFRKRGENDPTILEETKQYTQEKNNNLTQYFKEKKDDVAQKYQRTKDNLEGFNSFLDYLAVKLDNGFNKIIDKTSKDKNKDNDGDDGEEK